MWKVMSLLAVCVAACRGAPREPATAAAGQGLLQVKHTPAEIARGAYVAAIAGCTTCHTPMLPDGKLHDRSRELAGTELAVPGGPKIAVPNITPDSKTGIGNWTDAQIIAAIRQGVRPDGTRLAPIMPYPFYNRMTDNDAADLVAFIRSEPPIVHRVVRQPIPGMKPVDVAPPHGLVDRQNDPHAHGEYLASLMHCGACHTPTQGPFAHEVFAGGTRFGDVVAPNITSDRETGIGTWSEQDIADAVRAMRDPQGHPLAPPMADYGEAWSQLTDADAHALAVYVHGVPPIHHDVSAEEPGRVSARRQ